MKQVVLGAPEPAMDHHRDGAWLSRNPQVEELIRIIAIRDAAIRRARGQGKNVALHAADSPERGGASVTSLAWRAKNQCTLAIPKVISSRKPSRHVRRTSNKRAT